MLPKPFDHAYVPPPFAVKVVLCPEQIVKVPDIDDVGGALIVTLVVMFEEGQAPDAGIVYVTVYVPGVLKLGLIAPFDVLMDKPEVEEYVPPV